MKHLQSKYSVCQNDDGQYSILETFNVPIPKVVLDNLKRHDIVKIMDDCSKWLEEEEIKSNG